MSNTKKTLHALVVLTFLAAIYALAIGDVMPNPDDFARKLLDVRQIDASHDFTVKANPNNFGPQDAMDKTSFLFEGFEGGVVPPTGWTLDQSNPVATWEIDTYNPYEGSYNASCFYDDTYTDVQDEWLISPVMDFTAKQNLVLNFAWMGSYYWSVDPYDNCDLFVKITNDGTTWTDLFNEDGEGPFDSWVWYEKSIDLTAYETYTTAQVAFVYDGYDGAQFSLDAIDINDDPLPVGRCCYGDPTAPDCADNTEMDCDALGGDWTYGLNCTDDPCPEAGPNDDCDGAIEMTSGMTVVGSTIGATVDCPGVLDWNSVWYYFVNPHDCADATMDYCNVSPQFDVECLGVVVYDECPADCPNYILYTSNEWVTCPPAPSSQPITHFDMLPAGTFWYPVFMGNSACDPVEKEFSFVFTLEECPPAQPGDYCDVPLEVSIPAELDFVDFNTTCGRLDYYSGTCLGYYDGGEDIIYEVTFTEAYTVDVLVDPYATYSGFTIDDSCPPDPSSCMYVATAGYSSAEYGFYGITFAAGTYYIMVDTWPSPPCVDFKLTIQEPMVIGPGNTCEDPIEVKLPADIPYLDDDQHTCMRGNEYAYTCMGYYDGGEDAIYELDVTDACAVIITMDPTGETWSGLGLDDACPLDGSTCLAVETGYSSSPKVIEYTLAPGTYYLMVDTWPSPACLEDFDLTIDIGPSASITPASFDFGTVSEGDQGSEILAISNTGGGSLNYDINVAYDPPREIDGAYVMALGCYKPGMTMDVDFFAQNASSDAEWIDEITIDFPAGINVINSTDMEVIGATRYLAYDGTTGDGALVTYWNWNGGYGNMYSNDAAIATVTLDFDAGLVGTINLPYTMSGDDWGDPPHDISGIMTLSMCDPMTTWLVPTPTSGSVAGGMTDNVDAAWDATGLPNDTYDADIMIVHNGGKAEEIVPATITVEGGKAKAKVGPDPAHIYFKYAFDPVDLTLYMGHFNSPYTAADVATATVNGAVATLVGVTTHPSFTGDVVEMTFASAPFLDAFGAPLDTTLVPFYVDGTFGDATAFEAEGRVNVIGKSSSSGGKRWIVPENGALLRGDANVDGYLDIDDAVTLIEFIFAGGLIHGPIEIGDINCSHSVDIDDVVYFVDFIFMGGPYPCYD